MRVKVYRNLHKDCWSVVDTRTGRVAFHANHVLLKNVQFRVQQAGRERVIAERKKNVHAYIVGELIGLGSRHPINVDCPVTYNPYKYKSFVKRSSSEPIFKASVCYCDSNEVLVQC
jgi:hypothetical protein